MNAFQITSTKIKRLCFFYIGNKASSFVTDDKDLC